MKENFADITSRIAEPPKWYDDNGTPRYDDFHPDLCPDIYAHHVGLFLIECQSCRKKIHVEIHGSMWSREMSHPPRTWAYGDPPRHNCPGAGETMSSDTLAVLQFWIKGNRSLKWKRHREFEVVVDDEEDGT